MVETRGGGTASRRDRDVPPERSDAPVVLLDQAPIYLLRARCDSARRISRLASAFFFASRLSCSCLPCAMASSTLARPSLKYMRIGTSVNPCCEALPANLASSRQCRNSLRGRLGLWFMRLPISYSV